MPLQDLEFSLSKWSEWSQQYPDTMVFVGGLEPKYLRR